MTRRDLSHVMAIRRAVFIEEQGVDETLEMDGLDDECRHYLLWWNDEPVATVRVREADGASKIERMAVMRGFRQLGIGRSLLAHVLSELATCATVVLHAQTAAEAFYARLGFKPEGDIFDEAGIPHIRMVLRR